MLYEIEKGRHPTTAKMGAKHFEVNPVVYG